MHPRRRPVEQQYYTLVFLLGLMTGGFVIFLYAIYRIFFMEKRYCPFCEAELESYDFIE
ncbi:MAG: hypothetical protein ACOC44_00605 [Promethearchaeia archaeon]